MEARGGEERFRILFRVKVDSGSWLIIFAPPRLIRCSEIIMMNTINSGRVLRNLIVISKFSIAASIPRSNEDISPKYVQLTLSL